MKSKLVVIGIMFILIIANCITVFADAHSVTIQTEKTEVKVGDTFSVKINVLASDGINGMVATYNYDTDELELLEQKVTDSNFVDLGGATPNEIALMFNPENPSEFVETTETNIYELTFKVKEKVKEKATISLDEIELNTLALTNAEHTIEGQELTIKIINEESGINWTMILIVVSIVLGALFVVKAKRKK